MSIQETRCNTVGDALNPTRIRARVLILQGASEARGGLADWLTANDFDCCRSDDLGQAIESVRKGGFDLVAIDADSSGVGASPDVGWQAQAVRNLRVLDGAAYTPVVVFSRGPDNGRSAVLFDAGADEAVSMAWPEADRLARLRCLLRVKALLDQGRQFEGRLRQQIIRQRDRIERFRRRNRRLRTMAVTDPLTGVYNVRYFRQWLGTQMEIARRYRLVLSLLMIDVDHFKGVNDRYGHPFGDYVLRQFAGIVKDQARSSDVVARCGGDEFVIGLVETTRLEAVRFGQRLLKAVAGHSFEYFGQTVTITVSIGQAGFPEDLEVRSAEQMILFADQAMYQAKAKGRNDLICWHELDPMLRMRLASRQPTAPLELACGPVAAAKQAATESTGRVSRSAEAACSSP